MTDVEFVFRVLLETLTLFFMLVGLVGLVVPYSKRPETTSEALTLAPMRALVFWTI